MTVQSVTLDLPEAVIRRARQAAEVLNHPLEKVLADVLAASLPEVEDVPPDMRAELEQMTWFSEQQLWAIAHSTMADEQQTRLQALTELQPDHALTAQERAEQGSLQREYGRVTLRKARAYALLSLRSGQPLLTDN